MLILKGTRTPFRERAKTVRIPAGIRTQRSSPPEFTLSSWERVPGGVNIRANVADAYRLVPAKPTDQYRYERPSKEQDRQRQTYARIFPDDLDEFYQALE